MPVSNQMSAGTNKAAKFVAANPLAPLADPFAGMVSWIHVREEKVCDQKFRWSIRLSSCWRDATQLGWRVIQIITCRGTFWYFWNYFMKGNITFRTNSNASFLFPIMVKYHLTIHDHDPFPQYFILVISFNFIFLNGAFTSAECILQFSMTIILHRSFADTQQLLLFTLHTNTFQTKSSTTF